MSVARIDCWNHIGVWGSSTCPELEPVLHCHNCPVYMAAGRDLLEREASAAYRQQWTDLLAQEKARETSGSVSVLIFRLGEEWLALETPVCQEVLESQVIRRVPHRSGSLFLGLVNVRGVLGLCVSLAGLLGLEADAPHNQPAHGRAYKRLVVVHRDGDTWVFPTEEVAGVHRFHREALQQVPVTVAKASASFAKGLFDWQGQSLGYLDEALVFDALRRQSF